jgi:hypothetical protein
MNPQTSQDALTQLQNTQAGARSAADILAEQNKQLGVSGAQDTVTGLRGAITNTTKLLNQVAPSVMGRTANSLVTNAQATRQIANEQAPISQNLNQQNQDYARANEDYDRLNQQAQQNANLEYGDQQSKLSYLQNLYNTLFGREESAKAAAAAEADRQEKIREFNETLAANKASSGVGSYFGDLGGSSGGTKAGMTQRGDNGFAFTDANGNPVSAAVYAAATGQSFRDLLTKMAKAGDQGAKSALGFVGNDYGYDPNKVNSQALANLYNSLVWGTGRTANYGGISVGPAKSNTTILVNGKPVPENNVKVVPAR